MRFSLRRAAFLPGRFDSDAMQRRDVGTDASNGADTNAENIVE